MKNFRTYQLARQLYQDCQSLSLRGPAKDQFERAMLSVVLNLAEGSAKPTGRDRKKFYSIALGSLREVQVILEMINAAQAKQADTLGGSLYKLIQNPGANRWP
ncbi:MAG: four helix bundle protein [Bacteriovoracia bacterium]